MESYKNAISIAFTGGGTAGHIIPGLAVIEGLKNYSTKHKDKPEAMDFDIFWICSKSKDEQKLLENHEIPFKSILTGKLRRYFSLKNFLDIFLVLGGILQSLFILWRGKPSILFSKGGFVSLPPVAAAWILRIPVIIHESDFDPGLTTRLTAKFAKKILIPFNESCSFYPNSSVKKLVVTGNPVRSGVKNGNKAKGLSYCGVSAIKPVIFIAGGSQGAVQINKILEKCINELCERFIVIHQTGSNWTFEFEHKNYKSYRYIDEHYADIAAAADVVISRAGAGAIWEFALIGKPMILIPKGSDSSRGDQVRNADFFEKKGAAVVLKGKKVNTENLKNAILSIIENDDMRKTLVNNAALLCEKNAEMIVADVIITHLGGII
ncbi:MAG: undecaprenyldiphospho-muramoylpentapeptide beta-N-acetylglucosaminyltransferase [Bacteroidetes bacterium]|nr:undecaprenyldiphospho-muramoylpentapeptide beta-N-acetylglucosaminyltransferase [Bacteroidota bacterium]